MLAPQVIYEFWTVVTRPASANGLGMTTSEALTEVTLALEVFPCEPDPPDLLPRWLELCRRYGPSGKPAHDARLVAYMEAHGIEAILTLNPSDFARYTAIQVLTP